MEYEKDILRLKKGEPPFTKKEIEAVNDLFPAYLFRRRKTGEIWTSCCQQYKKLGPAATWTRSEELAMEMDHQAEPRGHWVGSRWICTEQVKIECPYCRKKAVVKEIGRCGRMDNLTSYRRAVLLRWYRGALWARAYDMRKDYWPENLLETPKAKLMGLYRFRPGLAEEASGPWYISDPIRYYSRQDRPLTEGKWSIHSPFTNSAEYGMGFDVVGWEELAKSPIKYCQLEKLGAKRRLLEILTACCFYPRQVEMLMKAGMEPVVQDLGEGKKNARAINWEESEPAKGFGLTKQELRDFLDTGRDIRTIALYKRLKREVPIKEIGRWVAGTGPGDVEDTIKEANKWNIPRTKLFRYLIRQQREINRVYPLRYWKDYLEAAEAIGLPVHREKVLLPEDLGKAHDSATQKHRARLEKERKASEKEQKRLMAERYTNRMKKLEEKYTFKLDGYLIRVPTGPEEIVEEGRKLQHCVAGYAERHVNGSTTILFMRKVDKPGKPWLTIEMHGNSLHQIHGYRNEGMYTAKGRFAPDPREVYRDFLDTWLAWLKAGSKRKNGVPVIPKGSRGKEEQGSGARPARRAG